MSKIGIVLSGGGAKGAYEVGVLKYFVDQGIDVAAISGASIGSLNGVVVASSENLEEAYKKLKKVWMDLAKTPPLKLKKSISSNQLASISLMTSFFGGPALKIFTFLANYGFNDGIFDNQNAQRSIDNVVKYDDLINGVPFYVSVYPTEGSVPDVLKYYLLNNTKSSIYLKAQDCKNQEELTKLLLASSALPFIFEAQEVNGKMYRDGGLGTVEEALGNTPLIPLYEKEKCDTIFVAHLSDGSVWSRHNYPDCNIIEIRPQKSISRKNMMDMLDFSEESILSWIDQGYEDSKIIINPIIEHLTLISHRKDKQDNFTDSLKTLDKIISKHQVNIESKTKLEVLDF